MQQIRRRATVTQGPRNNRRNNAPKDYGICRRVRASIAIIAEFSHGREHAGPCAIAIVTQKLEVAGRSMLLPFRGVPEACATHNYP
jgi:hypothetical protein